MARFFWHDDQLGRSPDAFAAHYGVPLDAANRLLFRAAREFFAAFTRQPPPPLLADDEERRLAPVFAQALDDQVPSEAFHELVVSLRGLQSHARELAQQLRDAEKAEVDSPAYARETWLRRAAIVVILALSAWFYWKAELTTWWQQHTGDTTLDAGQ